MTNTSSGIQERTSIAARALAHKGFRGVQEMTRTLAKYDGDTVGSLEVWPPAATSRELGELVSRLRWFLPDDLPIDIPILDPNLLPAAVDALGELETAIPDNVNLIPPGAARPIRDVILVWKNARRSVLDRRTLGSIPRVVIGDPQYFSLTEIGAYLELSRATVPTAVLQQYDETSTQAFDQFMATLDGVERVLVYGTGPSMTDILPGAVDADLVIACNSAVRDPAWISAIRPSLIAFADPVFHFGPSRYAAQFRADLLDAMDASGAYAVTTDRYLPLIHRHMPEIVERTIALTPTISDSLTIPSPKDPRVATTPNILTLLMLPMAGAAGSQVLIAGCDGRAPQESYFWKHSAEGQYADQLMATVQATHPSFFRDRVYVDYYDEHCRTVEKQAHALEQRGVGVACVTPSLIPALRLRM